jgi:hypothetical protein
MLFSLPLLLSLAASLMTSARAVNLFVSSYNQPIFTLQLEPDGQGAYNLINIAENNGSWPSPSWLTKDACNNILYCADEGLPTPDGSLASYSIAASGELTQIDRHAVINGPVSTVIFNKGKALAVAH